MSTIWRIWCGISNDSKIMGHMKCSISKLTLSKVNLLDLTFPQVLVKRTTGVKLRPSAIAIAEFQFPWWQHSIATSIRWSITFAAFEVFDARHTWLAVKADRELNLNFNVISGHLSSRLTDLDQKSVQNSPVSPIIQCISRLLCDEIFSGSGLQMICFDMSQSGCHFEGRKVCHKWLRFERLLWEARPWNKI